MPSLLAISAQERTLPPRKCAVHEWTLRITDQGYDAVPVNRRFGGISLFAFLVEFFPVSKDIETRRILSRIGYRENDVQAAWRDLGSPSQLNRDQVATLRKAFSGDPCLNERVQVGPDGSYSRRFVMRENDVWLIDLRHIGAPQSKN
jgi:hypothetical protein